MATLDATLSKQVRSILWRETGLSLGAAHRYEAADRALKSVNDPELVLDAVQDRMQLYSEAGKYRDLIDLGLANIAKFTDEDRTPFLLLVRDGLYKGKAWKKADVVFNLAKKLETGPKEMLPFMIMQARANYELSHCKAAIRDYEAVFKVTADIPEKAESKFRLGKCFEKEKNPGEAKKILQEVVGLNDSFWSPLAQNELHLVEVK